MKIKITKDFELQNDIRKRIIQNGGYCPCKLEKNNDTKCICKDFIMKSNNGWCDCGLYYKEV